MTDGEGIKRAFIAKAMERAASRGSAVIEPTADENRRDLQWWLEAIDSKAFLLSTNASAALLFPHYECRLSSLLKRVFVAFDGTTLSIRARVTSFTRPRTNRRSTFPTDVRFEYLWETDTVTFCPFKGLAKYYGVRVNGVEVANAFWCYEDVDDQFPDNGNAADIVKLKGMLSPYLSRLTRHADRRLDPAKCLRPGC